MADAESSATNISWKPPSMPLCKTEAKYFEAFTHEHTGSIISRSRCCESIDNDCGRKANWRQ